MGVWSGGGQGWSSTGSRDIWRSSIGWVEFRPIGAPTLYPIEDGWTKGVPIPLHHLPSANVEGEAETARPARLCACLAVAAGRFNGVLLERSPVAGIRGVPLRHRGRALLERPTVNGNARSHLSPGSNRDRLLGRPAAGGKARDLSACCRYTRQARWESVAYGAGESAEATGSHLLV